MSSASDDPRASATRFRLVLLVVLGVLLVAAIALNAWLVATRPVLGREGEAAELQRERDAVMATARQFMLRTYTYGPGDLDDADRLSTNRAQVGEVVTDKFAAAYEESLGYVEQLVAQQRVGQQAEVMGVGVQYLDGDSARALVTGESSFTQENDEGEAEPVRTQTFRVVVDLVKVEGRWLVDASELFAAAGDEAAGQTPDQTPDQTPGQAPEPAPSQGGTP